MIETAILARLVPEHLPSIESGTVDRREISREPAYRISAWAAYLRYQLARAVADDQALNRLVESSGAIGTGIFRVPTTRHTDDFPGFRIIKGYQFGLILLRGAESLDEEEYKDGIALDQYRVPIVELLTAYKDHSNLPDGYVSAIYQDSQGETCGLTARHVVSRYSKGQRVPIFCSDCGSPAQLNRNLPGLIDASIVTFRCGGPPGLWGSPPQSMRNAMEGEQVTAYFGSSNQLSATVMMSLQSPSGIKSAAVPKHFLMDQHGNPGDSGSLIASHSSTGTTELIGMYLGEADCEDPPQGTVTYGYGLDLAQVAELAGAQDLIGEFNV